MRLDELISFEYLSEERGFYWMIFLYHNQAKWMYWNEAVYTPLLEGRKKNWLLTDWRTDRRTDRLIDTLRRDNFSKQKTGGTMTTENVSFYML